MATKLYSYEGQNFLIHQVEAGGCRFVLKSVDPLPNALYDEVSVDVVPHQDRPTDVVISARNERGDVFENSQSDIDWGFRIAASALRKDSEGMDDTCREALRRFDDLPTYEPPSS